jgi:ribosome-binding ATPase YchF (GTP1/OBG family)
MLAEGSKPLKKANYNDSGWDLTASSEPSFDIRNIAGKEYVVNDGDLMEFMFNV